jgi:hypothetical protein
MRRMRVRVIASRTSAIRPERRENGASSPVRCRAQHAPREVVAREHHLGDAAHHLVDQLDRQADRALLGSRGRRALDRPADIGDRLLVSSSAPEQGGDEHVVGGSDSGSPRSISAIITPMRSITASTASTSRLSAGGGRRARRRARPRPRGSAIRAAGNRRTR